jgi:hypothetical protein
MSVVPAVRCPLSVALAGLWVLAAGVHVRGESRLEIQMPLGPYWRAGKFTPVRLIATVERGNKWVGLASEDVAMFGGKHVAGRGAGRTSVMITDRKLDAVVPWLVMDSRAKRPRFFVEYSGDAAVGPELRQLSDSERLVGFATGVDDAVARKLAVKPGGAEVKVIPVSLDPVEPLKGHAIAWELLDVVVLDASSLGRLDDSQISTLLALGVTVAVRGDVGSRGSWPWVPEGDLSVLRYAPAGLNAAGYHLAAYAPVADWHSGMPWAFRRRVLGFAAIVCVLLLGLALWRPPLVAVWAVLAVAGASGGLAWWWRGQVPIRQAGGEVVITGGGLVQTDGWTYQTSARDVFATLRWTEVSRPIYASRSALDDVWVSLNCDTAGRPREFVAWIPAGRRLAFLSRDVGTVAPAATPRSPVNSPLVGLVSNGVYAGTVKGELPTAPRNNPAFGEVTMEQWGAVILERGAGQAVPDVPRKRGG